MQPFPPRIVVHVLAGVALLVAVVLAPPAADRAGAHGSTQSPPSRYYACRFLEPDNPMCAAAWSANPQALYDWMEVNLGDAGGRHRELIADGRLCSAGRSKYGAFDRPGAWPVTALQTDGSGRVELVYENTAPHATEYYRVYLTRVGFDVATESPAWDDLEPVYDSGPLPPSPEVRLQVPLPERTAPAVLYVVWQRSDSPEAFYACSDVTVSGGGSGPASTVPSPPLTIPSAPPGQTSVAAPATVATAPPSTAVAAGSNTGPSSTPSRSGVVAPASPAAVSAPTTASGAAPGPPSTAAAVVSPPAAAPTASVGAGPATGSDGLAAGSPAPSGESSAAGRLTAEVGAPGGVAIEDDDVVPLAVDGGAPADPSVPAAASSGGGVLGRGRSSVALFVVGALVVIGLVIRRWRGAVLVRDGLWAGARPGSHYAPPHR